MWTVLSLNVQLGLSRSYTNKSKVMSIKFTKLTKILIIATIASLFSPLAKADTESLDTVALGEAFESAYFKNGENAFVQSGFIGQINTIIGIPKFPEQDIVGDSKEVHKLYEAALERQTSTGERLITKDLENPYDSSLRVDPGYGLLK